MAPPRDGPASCIAANRLPGLSFEESPPLHGLAPHRGWDLAWRTAGTAAARLPGSARSGRALSHERFLAENLELRQRRPVPPCLRRPLQFSSGLRGPLVRRCASGEGAQQVAPRRWPGAAVAGGLATGAAPGDARGSECGDLGDAAGTRGPGAPSALGWGWVAARTVRGLQGRGSAARVLRARVLASRGSGMRGPFLKIPGTWGAQNTV